MVWLIGVAVGWGLYQEQGLYLIGHSFIFTRLSFFSLIGYRLWQKQVQVADDKTAEISLNSIHV